jgi:hypothetical protein
MNCPVCSTHCKDGAALREHIRNYHPGKVGLL